MLLLFVAALVLACNPHHNHTCLAVNRAAPLVIDHNFQALSQHFAADTFASRIEYTSAGAELSIHQRFDNPTLISNFYILYGRVEAVIQAASGTGMVLSFYLQSDDLDEIDIVETFGGNSFQYQTNFFVKGNTSNWERGGYHDVGAAPQHHVHRYGIEWTSQKIVWTLDGVVTRTVSSENIHGFPTSPMAIKLLLWAGGDASNKPGTVQWAGGIADYAKLPVTMVVQSIYVEDYTAGVGYVYGYRDGSKQDLVVLKSEDEWTSHKHEQKLQQDKQILEEEQRQKLEDTQKQQPQNEHHRHRHLLPRYTNGVPHRRPSWVAAIKACADHFRPRTLRNHQTA